MNCPTCGAQNPPNAAFCSQCATNLMVPPGVAPGHGMPRPPMSMPGMYAAPVATRTSGMAIAGFVLSFFCGLLGLIFSILGHNEVKRSSGTVGGGGLALAGIIISAIHLVGWLVWLGFIGVAVNSAQSGRF
jgi:hypothetical protein